LPIPADIVQGASIVVVARKGVRLVNAVFFRFTAVIVMGANGAVIAI
jgi:hypothetical protein